MTKLRTLAVGTSAAAVLISGAILAPAAHASGSAVRTSGTCSQTSTWRLTAKIDNGAIEADLEVHTGHAGQVWSVQLSDNGTVVGHGRRTTSGPEGQFSFNRHIPNQAGRDVITAVAKQAGTGEVCNARVVFTG